MASVASADASPLSGYEYIQADSTADTDELNWAWLNPSTTPSNAALSISPASGSLASWNLVGGHGNHMHPSPTSALSPLALDLDQTVLFSDANYNDVVASTVGDTQFLISTTTQGAQQLFGADDLLFANNAFSSSIDFSSILSGLDPIDTASQYPSVPIIPHTQNIRDVSPWGAIPHTGDSPIFLMDDPNYITPSPPPQPQSSPSVSPGASVSPHSVHVKLEHGSSPVVAAAAASNVLPSSASVPMAIRKVRGAARVEKKRSPTTADQPGSLRGGSNSVGNASSGKGQFLIVTPDSVTAHAGKPNPFECFESAQRPSQKGRKGPLANDTKENALQVRRVGACFCCHARKVRCDKERPCRNCQKLMRQVPQVICWQFQDFLPILFPTFVRGHFRKEEMTRFMDENISGFTVDGAEMPCVVELFSGTSFSTTLQLRAKFFTPKTPDVLQHWHIHYAGANVANLQSQGAAPIGLDFDSGNGNSSSSSSSSSHATTVRDEIRKKAKEYIQAIVDEPTYAEQVTDSLRHTDLPRKILRIVQRYTTRADSSPIVRKALSIYAMHYVMTRHLCLTRQSIVALQSTKQVPQNTPWVTPRVLNRQIKSVIDEMMMREMQLLFESFSRSLKPKLRREWAPCLAAFLVLCLFMEAVETAADTFVVSENEISLRNQNQPLHRRSLALDVNSEIENLPFKQFAFQFHQVYQTHTRDAAAKSFNPLLDDAATTDGAELDPAAMEMVRQLRSLVIDRQSWEELDFLCLDPVMPKMENHPHLRNVAPTYTGRLVAKFLLSFTDEKYIFGPY